MKHIYYISVLIMALLQAFSAHASIDPNQRVFYVYRNDGNINTFFYSDVDSVVYSKIDIDSLVCDTYVTQEVWTPDTVVRIPLSVISRVGFQTPETIYTKEAVVMSDELLDYIVRSDSLDLYISQTVPASLLPQIGDKLITTKRTAALPGGFLGQVSEIDNSGDSIVVKCQQIPLTDVFERYYGVFDILGYTSEEGELPKETLDPDRYFDKTIDIGTIKVEYTEIDPDDTIDKTIDINTFFKGSVGCECSASITLPDMRVCGTLIIENGAVLSLNMSVGGTYKLVLKGAFFGELNLERAESGFKIKIPLLPALNLSENVGIFGRANGKVSVGQEFETTGNYGFTINATDYLFLPIPPLPSSGNLPWKISILPKSFSFNPIVISGDLSLTFGIFWDNGIELVHEKMAQGLIGMEAGAQLGIAGDLGELDGILKMSQTPTFYDGMRQNFNWSISPYIASKVKLKLLGFDESIPLSISLMNPVVESYFVPTFNNVKVSRNGNEYTFSADVEDNVLPGTLVGFRLVDEDDNTLYTSYFDTPYYKYSLSFLTIISEPKVSFNNYHLTTTLYLKPNKKYYLYPILKLFSTFEMLCSPRTLVSFGVRAKTVNARVFEVDATLSGLLYGNLDMLDNTTKAGFFYGEGASPESTGICVETAWDDNGEMICKLRNLKEETVYYYRAFALINGEYVYGDVESFKTQKRDGETVDLGLSVQWRGWNIGAEKPKEYGTYYAWAETSPKSNYTWDTYTDNVYDDSGNWTGCSINTDISDTYLDAAGQALGNNWRMPTKSEMQELIDKCTWTWTEIDGVNGYEVTGPNGNYIFLPAAGNFDGQSVNNIGSYGGYWTSTPNTESSNSMAGSLFFYGSDTYKVRNIQWSNRYSGRSIRPVKPYPN